MIVNFGDNQVIVDGTHVTFPSTISCPMCDGTGRQVADDRDQDLYFGERCTDACYHCGTTGIVDGHNIAQYMMEDLATQRARRAWSVYAANDCSNDFDWRLVAAENGMTASDYSRSWIWGATDKALKDMSSMTDIQIVKTWHASEVKAGRARFDWMKK